MKYKELKNKRNTKEYESWFLRYIPFEEKLDKEERKLSKEKKKLHKNKTQSNKGKKKRKTKKNKKGLLNIFNI